MKRVLFLISIITAGVIVIINILLGSNSQTTASIDVDKRGSDLKRLSLPLTGNYYLVQPGLLRIASQMSEEYQENWAYPSLLNAQVDRKYLHSVDTFQFNWYCDTILCKNYSKDNNGNFKHNCELVSSFDSVKVYNLDDDPFFTHGYYMDDRYKDTYMRAIRLWDEKLLDEIFLPDTCYWTHEFLTISRLIIEDGKLVDVKSMRSHGVREPYSILP